MSGKKLIIVESPGKLKKIASFVGPGWTVEASRGHVRDLPAAALGVNTQANFILEYDILKDKIGVVKRLRKAIEMAEEIYLATDPDREGEAIAWHILQLAKTQAKGRKVYRVTFTAITKQAVLTAIATPRELDLALVEAQQARRTVDRLVGYLVSPLACQSLKERVSAGRVQSVCLRLVVEREREIAAFVPAKYWTLDVQLTTPDGEFKARLATFQGKKIQLQQKEQADKIMRGLTGAMFWIGDLKQAEKPRTPLPPFTTSSLQQAASKALNLSPERTMSLAQGLYEAGLITYMRTDSVAVAPEAQTVARDYIVKTYGEAYAPPAPRVYKTKAQNAQEAHEAIRPTDVGRLPDSIEGGEGTGLYGLIWKRFVASQMADARYSLTLAQVLAGASNDKPYPLTFEARGRVLIFDGFLKVYEEVADEGEQVDEHTPLPPLTVRQQVAFAGWLPEEHTTKAPGRYTEAGLVQSLEQRGIGRPSTYASMVKVIKDKSYVRLEAKRLIPTALGINLADFLIQRFPVVFDFTYTASLEDDLDQIASGKATRLAVLQAFWNSQFSVPLKALASEVGAHTQPKQTAAPKVVGECPKCGGKLMERHGPHGTFAGCENYPKCKGAGKPVTLTSARKGGARS